MQTHHKTEAGAMDTGRGSRFTLRLTPAEWRAVLKDGSFLKDSDNSCRPRVLMGLPVQIVPDHWVNPV